MALIRWEPARELATIQSEMNRLFNTFFEPPSGGGSPGNGGAVRRWIPAMDLVESQDDFVLRADLPGLSESDVNIELEDNVLTISGERKSEHEERKEGYYRVERASGAFSRSLTLPEGVDPERVKASFDRGVLEVRIPKPEERKPRRVTISATGGAPSSVAGGAQETIEGSEHSEHSEQSA
jgi:HSP20 family protein